MTKAQTGTESYVTCKTGGGRVKTLEYRSSETTLPMFERCEKTKKSASSRLWNSETKCKKRRSVCQPHTHSGYLP
jgi:hypothetical protein